MSLCQGNQLVSSIGEDDGLGWRGGGGGGARGRRDPRGKDMVRILRVEAVGLKEVHDGKHQSGHRNYILRSAGREDHHEVAHELV
jgi:hypothetical protein